MAFWISPVYAQDPVQPIKAGPIDISGILDVFYSKNFNNPDSRENQLHNFDFYAQRPRLEMAEVGLSHDPAPLGFEVDFGFGDTYKVVESTEPDSPLKNMLQLTVSLKPASLHGVQIDFGKFQTSAGIESAETLSGWNYSRSILFVYAQPNYHFGLRSVVPLGKKVEVGLQVVNGWNRVLDGNGGKTVAITADYKTEKLSWYNDYYIGPEKIDGTQLRRTLFDTTVVASPLRWLSLDVNLDDGSQERLAQHSSTWIGVAGSARIGLPRKFVLSPRGEWFSDPEGFTTGRAQTVHEFTLTGQKSLHKGVVARLEYRRDSSNQHFFDVGSQTAASTHQATFLVGLIGYFGSLGR